MDDELTGDEVSVDLADLVEVLAQEKAELSHQVAMLKAAVRKLKRDAAGGAANGEVREMATSGPPN